MLYIELKITCFSYDETFDSSGQHLVSCDPTIYKETRFIDTEDIRRVDLIDKDNSRLSSIIIYSKAYAVHVRNESKQLVIVDPASVERLECFLRQHMVYLRKENANTNQGEDE